MNTNMARQFNAPLEQLAAVRALELFNVAMDTQFVLAQVVGSAESPVTQRALVRFISRVDRHMTAQISRIAKRLVAHAAFVRFLSAVSSTVPNVAVRRCESFAANGAFVRLLSRMNSTVHYQRSIVLETFSTFGALELTAVSVHVLPQGISTGETFLTLNARI